MTKICYKCGFGQNPDDAKFCGICGSIILSTEKIEAIASIIIGLLNTKRRNPRSVLASHNDLCPCGSGKKYKNCHGMYL